MKELSFWGELSLYGRRPHPDWPFLPPPIQDWLPAAQNPAPLHSNTNPCPCICMLGSHYHPHDTCLAIPYTRKVVFCIDSTVKASCNMCSIDKQATSAAPDSFIHPPLGMPHLPLMDPTMRPPSFSCHPPFSSSSVTWVCPFCVLFCRHLMIMQFVFWLVSILLLLFLYLYLSLSLLHCSSSLLLR